MIEINVHPLPMFIKIDANEFGRLFANMGDNDQVAVFRSMIEHMNPHKTQWDYIAIELKKPENQDVALELFSCLQFSLDQTS